MTEIRSNNHLAHCHKVALVTLGLWQSEPLVTAGAHPELGQTQAVLSCLPRFGKQRNMLSTTDAVMQDAPSKISDKAYVAPPMTIQQEGATIAW